MNEIPKIGDTVYIWNRGLRDICVTEIIEPSSNFEQRLVCGAGWACDQWFLTKEDARWHMTKTICEILVWAEHKSDNEKLDCFNQTIRLCKELIRHEKS